MKSAITESFVDTGEFNLKVCQWGDLTSKTCLVFLNGIFHGHEAWKKQIRDPKLNRYRCLCIDYRDCGMSQPNRSEVMPYGRREIAQDILCVLDTLGINTFNLIGNSIGTQIGIFLAANQPHRCRSLFSLNSSVHQSIHSRKLIEGFQSMYNEGIDAKHAFTMVYPWFFGASYLEKLHDLQDQILRNYTLYNSNRTGLSRFLSAFIQEPDLIAACGRIQCPAVIVSSEQDVIFPPDSQEDLQKRIPGSILRRLRRVGHSAMIEAYVQVNEWLAECINKTEGMHA